MGQAERVREVAATALSGSGVVVEDVAVHPAGKRRLVRVGVARDVADLLGEDLTSPVEPLTLDEVAEASRTVGEALDADDPMGNAAYTLEVTSLGVDHPLTTPAHFRRNVGRLLKLQVAAATDQEAEADESATEGSGTEGSGTRGGGTRGGDTSPTPRTIEARLVAAGPDGIRLADDPDALLSYARVSAAKVQVEFTRPGGKDD